MTKCRKTTLFLFQDVADANVRFKHPSGRAMSKEAKEYQHWKDDKYDLFGIVFLLLRQDIYIYNKQPFCLE